MFNVDFQSRTPIYEQIVNQVEKFIISGVLKSNEQLPSVRQVASDLGINPNTIQKAYAELEHKGVITSVMGKGNFVTDNTNPLIMRQIEDIFKRVKKDINDLQKLGLSNEEIKQRILKD